MDKNQASEMVIFTVVRQDQDISIRLDRDSLAFHPLPDGQVINLTLHTCENADSVFEDLCEFVDRPVAYKIAGQGDATLVSFWLDWGVLDLEVKCNQITESRERYADDDLRRKIDRLSFLYQNSKWQSEANEHAYNLMIQALQRMIKKEFETSQQKIEFFQKTMPDRASFLAGATVAYQKVLAKMKEIEKEVLNIRYPD